MKMVLIAYNESLEEEVEELLQEAFGGQPAFTKWTRVLGQGQLSEPHLLSHVWPKANRVLMTCVDDARSAKILDGVRQLRKTLAHEGIKAFCWDVEDAT